MAAFFPALLSAGQRARLFAHPNDVTGAVSVIMAVLVAVLDNLVKGAAGSAVQNMNIMLGLDERTGL